MLDKNTKKEYNNTLKGIDDMCDLANKLHEENEQLKQRIDNICREINDRPTMTTTEVMVKLMEMIE